MTTPQTPAKPDHGSVSTGFSRGLDGNFTYQAKLSLSNFAINDLSTRLGQVSVFGGDLSLKYVQGSPTPLQVGLAMTYLDWKMPKLGPVLSEIVLRNAMTYIDQQNWDMSHGAQVKLSLDRPIVKNLEITFNVDYKIEEKKNVTSQGVIGGVQAIWKF